MHHSRTIVVSLALVALAALASAQPPPVTQPPPVAQPPAAAAQPPATQPPATQPPATQPPAAAQPPDTAGAPPAAVQAPAQPPEGKGEILEQILVKVNGEIFSKTDLEARQVAVLRARRQQLSDEELKKAMVEVTPDLLVDAVDEMLVMQRGRELGYKLTDEQYTRVLENIRKENKLDTDEAFQAALKQEGMTMADLRKQLERQMIVNQVQQVEVMSKLGVSEDEALTFYGQHKNEFTTPASITLRELVINVPGDGKTLNVAQDEEAKARCEQALARVKAGEPFEKVVAEMSDAPSKANGGLVGPLTKTELSPEIQKLIEPLNVGGVAGVFRTPKGWAILKLDAASLPIVETFEQAREKIADRVFAEKRRVEMEKYLKKLRDQAIIEWKNEEMHKLYDARLAAPAPAPALGSFQ